MTRRHPMRASMLPAAVDPGRQADGQAGPAGRPADAGAWAGGVWGCAATHLSKGLVNVQLGAGRGVCTQRLTQDAHVPNLVARNLHSPSAATCSHHVSDSDWACRQQAQVAARAGMPRGQARPLGCWTRPICHPSHLLCPGLDLRAQVGLAAANRGRASAKECRVHAHAKGGPLQIM